MVDVDCELCMPAVRHVIVVVAHAHATVTKKQTFMRRAVGTS